MTLNISDLIAPMEATHRSGINQTLKWRLQQLDTLMLMITEHEGDFVDALFKDLHKERTESIYCELLLVKHEIQRFQRELKNWMKPQKVSYPGALFPAFCEVHSVPLSEPGCLIIAPFNYPVCISLLPIIGAFGGGNPCVLKPSELCPAVSSLFSKLVPKYFEKGALQVVEGGVEETTKLLEQHWGLIHFTGSERVGRIVQEMAAKTLSPTILELGGKTPTIIAHDCPDDMAVVCNRILAGKLMNCGQTCVAPDFVICHKSKLETFCTEAISAIERLFGKDPEHSLSELPRIVSESHTKRQLNLIQEIEKQDSSKVLYGGTMKCNPQQRLITPTLVLDPSMDSQMMKEEIFGPILPIIPFETDEEAIQLINNMHGTPLALYVFTKSQKRYETYMSKIPSGSVMRNETLLQFIIPDFPFGGLGTSGIGSYQGKASFDAFTHKRSSLYHPCHAAFEYGGLRCVSPVYLCFILLAPFINIPSSILSIIDSLTCKVSPTRIRNQRQNFDTSPACPAQLSNIVVHANCCRHVGYGFHVISWPLRLPAASGKLIRSRCSLITPNRFALN
jgi:NAD-dependent aldehyde dehydrogenases